MTHPDLGSTWYGRRALYLRPGCRSPTVAGLSPVDANHATGHAGGTNDCQANVPHDHAAVFPRHTAPLRAANHIRAARSCTQCHTDYTQPRPTMNTPMRRWVLLLAVRTLDGLRHSPPCPPRLWGWARSRKGAQAATAGGQPLQSHCPGPVGDGQHRYLLDPLRASR